MTNIENVKLNMIEVKQQPEDRYIIIIEPQRGLFGYLVGDNMSVALHAGHDSEEYDMDKTHRTLVLKFSGELENERWEIDSMKLTKYSMNIELKLIKGDNV
jgi:hypothetical protein